ncbi:NADH-ubiquinone oxidoreductase B18 subunit-domain-containing protein [Aspergillus recurvatus]
MTVAESVKSAIGLADTQATREEMSAARLPLQYRDSCAHLLIPLNRCRQQEWYLPWKCEDERHSYEKCQYEEFKKRVAKMDELRAAKDAIRLHPVIPRNQREATRDTILPLGGGKDSLSLVLVPKGT